MQTVYLILGGNLGDRYKYLQEARALIEQSIGPLVTCSSFYETEPWGFAHDNSFLNQAIEVETRLNPFEILNEIKVIETSLGRSRGNERYSARTIDIDILFFGDAVIDAPELTIPHPEMAGRRFVLDPMCEIAPDLLHPLLQKTMQQLLAECQDACKVVRA